MDIQTEKLLNSLFANFYGPAPVAPTTTASGGAPRTGQGVYGMVPAATPLPDVAGDLAAQYPNLGATNSVLSGNILSRLRGEIPMDVQNRIQDAGARFGVTSGMPGSGLARSGIARNLGLTSLDLQNQGLAAYNQTIPTISRTQTVAPETQIALGQSNAALAAAPDPTLQGLASLDIFNRYMANMANRGGGGGFSPAGGTGMFGGNGVVNYGGAGTISETSPYVGTPGNRESNIADGNARSAELAGLEDFNDWVWNEGGYGLGSGDFNNYNDFADYWQWGE